MISGLKPYPAYKDSGVPWLGLVPEHWRVDANRAFLRHVIEQNHPAEQMLSVTINKGIVPQQSLLSNTIKKDSSREDKSAYKLVQPGDIVYNKMRAWQGAFGASELRGIVSPAYIVQCPRDGVNALYLHYLFRTPLFAREAERWSYGIASDMWSLRPEHFKTIYTCLPSSNEQAAIVRFLDYMDRRISRYIRTKQKLIKLLEEQKQAVIHHAVTGQIDVCTGKPYPAYKASGTEWLGMVPEHWDVKPLRALFRHVVDQNHPDEPMLSVTITKGIIPQKQLLENSIKKDSSRDDKSAYKLIQPGDIAYNKMRAWQGAFGASRFRGIVSPAYVVHRPHEGISPLYFHYLLRSAPFASEAERWSYGIASDMWSLRPEHFRLIVSCLPPPEEQAAIVRYLDEAAANTDRTIDRARREIELLKEYRTRLMADVVTGKLDVRAAAAELPETTEKAGAEETEEFSEDLTEEDAESDRELDSLTDPV